MRADFLLFESEKHGKDDENERNDVVPSEGFGLEDSDDDGCEHGERNGFLNDFQLDEVERAAVDGRADAVGRNHERILEQGNAPRQEDDQKERPVLCRGMEFDELELAIPCESHKDIGNDEQKDGVDSFHGRWISGCKISAFSGTVASLPE